MAPRLGVPSPPRRWAGLRDCDKEAAVWEPKRCACEEGLGAVARGFQPGSWHQTEALLASEPSLSVGAPLRISDVGGKAEDRGRGPEPGHVSLLVAEKPARHGTWPAQQSGSGVSAWECPEVPVRTQAPDPSSTY